MNAIDFIKNGVAVFRAAANGRYELASPNVNEFRKEFFDVAPKSNKANLNSDRKK
jgi:hypothetical protein